MAQETKVVYNNTVYNMPGNVTPSTALEVLKKLCPELGSAAYATQNGDGSITVFGEAQRKSAGETKVVYNNTVYNMPGNVTPSTALEVLKKLCPELGSAAYATQNGDGSITVFGEAQRKSVDVRTVYSGGTQVIYNGTTYNMPGTVTPSTALEVLKKLCPELGASADATNNADGTITVFGQAQRKSAGETKVVYNNTVYNMPGNVTPSTALEVLKKLCPELGSAAYATQNGDGSITVFGEAQRKSLAA